MGLILHFEGGRIIPTYRWERICGEGKCCILGGSWGRMHYKEESLNPSPCEERFVGRIAVHLNFFPLYLGEEN